ncbi:ribbon-helix-helix, copG family protein [Clostridium botulinum 202F]|nr:ribbon-helix-helix, copG family protein [Clostridium botulinum 202F]KAI3344824.1 hypothetical protein CIT17_15590 [Clostridium botulinum]KON11690.1 hypothetical protein ACP50_16915 [Clostridium botulinum]MBY6988288.1 hypothetical protein [Clostridium botulinum]NFH00589.1 hypothetical protein [Clostridium botulinum]
MAKDKILQIRISEDYHSKLKKLAIERGIDISTLIRSAVEYIPGTSTEEEIEKGLNYVKICDSSAMLFALKNISDVIKNQYNYEFNNNLPEDKVLLDMYNEDIFRGIKQIALSSVIHNLECDNNKLDKETEELIKKLIKDYMSK